MYISFLLRSRTRNRRTARNRRRQAPCYRPQLFIERLEDLWLPSVSLGANFDGLSSAGNACGCSPPDTIGAAGPSSFIEAVNTALGIYNKTAGTQLGRVELASFFNAGLGGILNLSDPVVIYDEMVNKFFLGILDFNFSNQSRLDVAISNTSNPSVSASDWTFRRYNVNDGIGGFDLADYPKIGYNADGYMVSVNMFPDISRPSDHVTSLSIRKSDLTGFLNVIPGGASHFTFAPATMHGAGPGAPMWFVEDGHQGGGGSTVTVVRMTDPFSSSPAVAITSLAVNPYGSAPNPRQPGGSLGGRTSLGTRFYFSALRNVGGQTRLVAAHAVGSGDGVRARWYEFNVGGASPTLTQQGEINQGAGVDTFFPTIDIAPSGALGMTFSETSSTARVGYLSMYVTARSPADAPGTTQAPVVAKQGTAFLNSGGRAGDYSFTAIDPVDGTFWSANEYASPGAAPNWRTWIAHFSLGVVTHFAVSAPREVTAGEGFNVRVTALDQFNNVVPDYLGTVQLTSTDPQVPVPGQHTYTASDQGVYPFPAALRTAGPRTITATDTARGINGNTDLTVIPAAANHFDVSAPDSVVAGVSFRATVTARDPFNNRAVGYRSTIELTSTDPQVLVLGQHTYTASDQGVYPFPAALLTAGRRTITARDTVSGINGNTEVTVDPAAASHFLIEGPSLTPARQSHNFKVSAEDPYGNTDTNYRDTVRLTSTDPCARLPPDPYTYTSTDSGVHLFTVALCTVDIQTVIARDTAHRLGPATVTVVPALFDPAVNYSIGLSPVSVAAGDFTGSGIVDLVTASSDGIVSVLLGNGDGSFQKAMSVLTNPSLYSLAVADFDNDGIDDLVTVDFNGIVSVYRGVGDGTFAGPVFSWTIPGDFPIMHVLVGDFNGDGLPDIAVAYSRGGSGSVSFYGSVLLNDPHSPGENFYENSYPIGFRMEGEVQSVIPTTWAAGYFLKRGRQAGALDIAVTQIRTDGLGNQTGQITTILHNGQVEVSEAVIPPEYFSAAAAGDVNGDGIDDLVAVTSGGMVVVLGLGDGTFTQGMVSSIDTDGHAVVVADFDGDGNYDIVTYSSSNGPYDAPQRAISILVGNGDGTFQDAVSYGVGSGVGSVAAGDFEGDGVPDLAVANGDSDNVSVLLNRPNGPGGPGSGSGLLRVSSSRGSHFKGNTVDFAAVNWLSMIHPSPSLPQTSMGAASWSGKVQPPPATEAADRFFALMNGGKRWITSRLKHEDWSELTAWLVDDIHNASLQENWMFPTLSWE